MESVDHFVRKLGVKRSHEQGLCWRGHLEGHFF